MVHLTFTSRTPGVWATLGGALVVVAVIADVVADGDRALEPDIWTVNARELLWTATIGAGVAMVYFALRAIGASSISDGPDPTDPATGLAGRWPWLDRAAAPLVLGGVLTILAVQAVEPRAVDWMAREDHPVEWVAFAGTMATAFFAALLARVVAGGWRALLIVTATGFLWVSLEEVSYFQRMFEYSTPESLEELNDQQEANLHNTATDVFQNAYYFSIAVLFTGVPLLYHAGLRRLGATMAAFVPSRTPIALAIGSVAMTYACTPYPAHHLSVWMAVWFLATWTPAPRTWRILLLVTVGLGSALAFALGDDLLRPWALSEYRETFAALAFAVWMYESSLRLRNSGARADQSRRMSGLNDRGPRRGTDTPAVKRSRTIRWR